MCRQAADPVLDEVTLALEDHSVAPGDLQPRAVVAQRGSDPRLAELGFDGEPGLPVTDGEEVDLPAGLVTQVAELDPVTFAVFEIVAKLEELEGDQVLEAPALVRNVTAFPEIRLGHLLEAADPLAR